MATKIVNSLAGLPAEVTVKKLVRRSNYDELWISFPESELSAHTAVPKTALSRIPARTTPSIILQSITDRPTCICSVNVTIASPAAVPLCSIRTGFTQHCTSHSCSTSTSVSL